MPGPLVSIGVPTRNGAAHLAEILDSLSAQDHPEIEILVADNASTDATADIIAAAAARDPRLRPMRTRVNIGQRENCNRLFQASRGAYFMWASDHDLRPPDFVSRLLAALDADATLALAYPRFALLGETIDTPTVAEAIDTRGMDRVRRIWHVIRRNRTGMMIHGLYRAAVLERTELLPRSPGAYRLLMTQVALHGAVAEVPECVLTMRLQRRESAVEAERRRTDPDFGFWDPADPWARQFPGLRMIMGQMDVLRGAAIPAEEKRQLLNLLLRQAGTAFPMLREEVVRLTRAPDLIGRMFGGDAFGLARAALFLGYVTLASLIDPNDAGVAALRRAMAVQFADRARGQPGTSHQAAAETS